MYPRVDTSLYTTLYTPGIPRCTYHTLYMLSAVGTGAWLYREEALGSILGLITERRLSEAF